jgi:hypothetical protein
MIAEESSLDPYQRRIVSSGDPPATSDEIWRREYLTCGARTHEERAAYADRAKSLEEAKAAMRNQSAVEIANKKERLPGDVTLRVDVPENAAELRDVVVKTALRTFQIVESEFENSENTCARWFALVALTYIPETMHHHCRKGRLGPTRAKLILQLKRGGSIDWEGIMRRRWPVQYAKALKLGGTLRAAWSRDEKTRVA